MSLNGHLSRPAVASRFKRPTRGRRAALCPLFGLASDGVYMCPGCYQPGGSLLHCPSTLTRTRRAVHFCCTVLGVASTRRYLASCPVKPGLSSSAAFRHLQLRPFVLLKTFTSLPYFPGFVHGILFYTLKQLPPINSRRIELCGICSLLTPRK